jgi:hypothetical protein
MWELDHHRDEFRAS